MDVKKDDGFAALHLASFNGHRAVVESLVTDGKATLDLVTYRKQTPLMLGVSQVITIEDYYVYFFLLFYLIMVKIKLRMLKVRGEIFTVNFLKSIYFNEYLWLI